MNRSNAHLYNLRRTPLYRTVARRYTKTKSVVVNIGEGTRPDTGGLPGHIRIDAIHQGDLQKKKGVYHINAVDEVTQWEIVASSRELLAAEYHLEDT